MNRIILILLVILPLTNHAATTVTGIEVRDQIIESISDSERDDHTCRRVRELGEGTVSEDECIARLKTANESCLEIAKENIPSVNAEKESKLLTHILIMCPVAKVLDIGFHVINEKVYVQWSEIGKAK